MFIYIEGKLPDLPGMVTSHRKLSNGNKTSKGSPPDRLSESAP